MLNLLRHMGDTTIGEPASIEEVAKTIFASGAVEIRDVDSGEEPFVYSTGNRGPGYVMIKGLVGQPKVLNFLSRQLAHKIAPLYQKEFEFIEGNATGGMVPAWQLRIELERVLGLEEGTIPYNYLREARKSGGHGELITGKGNNPLIIDGMPVLVFEELVNYAGTTTNAARIFREEGHPVTHVGCILTYDHAESNQKLKEAGLILDSAITLPQLLDYVESTKAKSPEAVRSYRGFLASTVDWQLQRNLVIPADSAKVATEKGHKMRELSTEEALSLGAPAGKIKEGIVYWAQA